MQVTVWNEYRHEKNSEVVRKIYPDGIHTAISDHLQEVGHTVRTAILDEPHHGLSDKVLSETDVLIYWGHCAHDEVDDAVVERTKAEILDGMGFIPLHSSHKSKLFKSLMGTSCTLRWREATERERIWIVEPGHPIASGLSRCIELSETEMYGERFDIPAPETLVFVSWFEGGEVFRSGCCYQRGSGRVFYFRPGHETYPIYHDDRVLKVISNAVEWAAPTSGPETGHLHVDTPLENLD